MRPLDEWDETDLNELVLNGVQEGLRLDYKQSESLARTDKAKAELAKDVSAFANSAGGRIIYGVVEADQLPVAIDKGADPNVITREWVEQVINSRISPRVSGIIIKPIQLQTGGMAYVIDIPQATTFAPHQANHRYFRRFNFESVAMEDYEVKDAMRRASTGDPYLYFTWGKAPPTETGSQRARLTATCGNHASEPILYASVKVYLDQRISPDMGSSWQKNDKFMAIVDGEQKPLTAYTRIVLPSGHMPFFKEAKWLMLDVLVDVPLTGSYLLGYEFISPGISKSLLGSVQVDGYRMIHHSAGLENLLRPMTPTD